MSIELLKRVIVENREDGTQVSRLPNNQELMDKINEIILYINRLEKEKRAEMPKFSSTRFQ